MDLVKLEYDAPRHRRYPVLIFRTLALLRSCKPPLVFVQNPSLLLALLVVSYGRICKTPVIVDAHNAGVYPFEGRRAWATRLAFFLFRKANLTIVTNESLKSYVEENGGRACILPDPIPEIHKPAGEKSLSGDFNVMFICTWSADEPYSEVIESARLVEPGTVIHITGNSKGREKNAGGELPANVVLTGFIPEEEFQDLLWSCDVVMDLTTRENCLVCGAYEAVATGKPLLLSDTKALRNYFRRGTVFSSNDARSLAHAMNHMRHHLDRLMDEMRDYRDEIETVWGRHLNDLRSEIGTIMGKTDYL